MHRGLIALVIGIVIGVALSFIIMSLSSKENRYSLVSSSDGSVVHKIDTKTGRVWVKNSYMELDPDGQPITIWYWEELTLDRPGAARLAKNLESTTAEVRNEELERMKEEAREKAALKEKRLDEIYTICGEDTDCAEEKCAVGFKGGHDPEWTAYCVEQLKNRIVDVIIKQCRGDEGCVKTYCINKYNNTYPAVSDCVSEINIRKAQSGDSRPETPSGGTVIVE